MSFYYCCSPYSKYPAGRDAACEAVAAQAALLIAAGVPVFVPITHSHPVSGYLSPGVDTHETWMAIDRPFMQAAKGAIVVMLNGWETSRGVLEEIAYFRDAGKPVHWMEPGDVPLAVLPSNRRLLAVCGVARSGKDTAAQALADYTPLAFADGVREALLALDPMCDVASTVSEDVGHVGWELAKGDPEIRRLLQRMGTEAGRNIHGEDCWIRLAERKIAAIDGNVVITDCRFENEAAAVRSWGGLVVRIDRPGTTACNEHASERLDFAADATITNDGTIADLHAKVRDFANGMGACRELSEAAQC
jgi:hypothetical protein